VIAVLAVLLTGSATPLELSGAYRQLIRPFSAIAGIMVMTACVQRSGLLKAFAGRFLNLLTLQSTSTPDLHYLVVLAGGDLGPRLLPSGSLAGLLWLAACRRQGVRIPLRWFVTTGAITLLPALLAAVGLLAFLNL
jgi:arsenical pump membrane protein